MPLVHRRPRAVLASAPPEPPPPARPPTPEPQPAPAVISPAVRAASLAAIAELRNEIQALDQQMHPEESNMPDDSNASLSPEERALIQQFRESHLSKAEQKAEFERIYNLPVSQWNKSDFDRMAGWLPDLLQNRLPW